MFWEVDQNIPCDMKVIIYGAGDKGISTFIMLLNAGIYVSAFCDADKQKQKIQIMNKRVISPEELYTCIDKENILVFIGSQKYKREIKGNLQKRGFTRIYENRGGYQNKVYVSGRYRYGRKSWYSIIEQAYHKQIYIYGTSTLELEFAKKMSLTDIQVAGFLVNDKAEKNEQDILEISVSRLAEYDKENIMVYVMSEIPGRVKVLEEIGLKIGYNYRIGPYIYGGYRMHNPYVRLDVNCGFSYVDCEETPGYTVIGNEKSKYRIMILGASTTDPQYSYYQTWVDFLKSYLDMAGIDVSIYNGAMQAYSEQQCLLKLIRDVPAVAPDIVVHYGGGIEIMNMVQNERFFHNRLPFAFNYSVDILKGIVPKQRGYINQEVVKELFGIKKEQEVCLGLSCKESDEVSILAAENYLYAVNCMHAICEMKGITFLNFLDPVLVCAENMGKRDKEKLYHDEDFPQMKELRKSVCLFRKNVLENINSSFHTDLSQELNADEMYDDVWHPNERANRVLGKCVFDKVLERLKAKDKELSQTCTS